MFAGTFPGADAKESSKAEAEALEGGGPTVTEQDIANIVAQWTGIPIEKVSADETERLIKMEEVLHGRVIGQEEAVSAIARAIRRARVGLKNPNRPIASFIFAGPTGVGKSELAKTLASYYFGSEEAMVSGVLLSGVTKLVYMLGAGDHGMQHLVISCADAIAVAVMHSVHALSTLLDTFVTLCIVRFAWICLSSWRGTQCLS